MAYNFDYSQANPLKGYILSDALISFPEDINTPPAASTFNNLMVFNPNYNTRNIDEDIFYRNIKAWEQKRYYGQPFQQGDTIRLQFLGRNTAGAPPQPIYTAYLVSCETQRIVKSYSVVNTGSITVGGQYLQETKIPLHDIVEGYYYVIIRLEDPINFWFSYMAFEPIDVRKKHDNTILLEYKNSSNDFGILYQSGISFMLRVHGFLGELTTDAKFNVYEDEPLNMSMISGIPFRVWQLMFGGNGTPIPTWMADKLNIVLLHDDIKVDGKAYVRNENAKLEPNRKERTPFYSWGIQMREADNDTNVYLENYQNSVFITTGSDYVPDAPVIYARDFVHGTSPTTKQIRRFFNGYSAFLGWMNSEFKALHNIGGTFGVDDYGRLLFKPSSTSEATAYNTISLRILPYSVIFEMDLSDAPSAYDLQIDMANTFATTTYAYSTGDGSADFYGSTSPFASISHNYQEGRVYRGVLCLDTIEALSIDNSSLIEMYLSGLFPKLMEIFEANNIPVKGLRNNMFKYSTGGVTNLEFNNCTMNTIEVDRVLKFLYDSKLGTIGTQIELEQASAAPPSLDVKKIILPTLINRGLIINID